MTSRVGEAAPGAGPKIGPRRVYALDGVAGLVERHRRRTTGTVASVYAAEQAGFETDPETPWAAVCEDHATLSCERNLTIARELASDPTTFCGECRERAQAKRPPGR